MISVLMPYWNRQEAADTALTLFAKTYPDFEGEILVVDDGNAVPFRVPDVPLPISVFRMPVKDAPTPQSRTWNAAVQVARGDILVMNCIEVLHEEPVLPAMVAQLEAMGPMGYVLASAWCPEHNAWHCHSSVQVPDCPPGCGIGFCGALHRSLYLAAGGFDEDYMQGAGYEDRDFIRRLVRAGAHFRIRDDLKVTHPKTKATIQWPLTGFVRNEALFRSKWPC